jgi:hypothetical protein
MHADCVLVFGVFAQLFLCEQRPDDGFAIPGASDEVLFVDEINGGDGAVVDQLKDWVAQLIKGEYLAVSAADQHEAVRVLLQSVDFDRYNLGLADVGRGDEGGITAMVGVEVEDLV